jgi:phage-related minor tail protein
LAVLKNKKAKGGELGIEGVKKIQEVADLTKKIEQLNERLKEIPGEMVTENLEKASKAMGALKDITAQTSAQFQEAFAKKFGQYAKTVHDFGGQAGDIVVKSFQGMEDALVRFVQTGKLSFSDFARSIIADMTKIAIKQAIIAPLMSGFSGWLGNTFGPAKPNFGNAPLGPLGNPLSQHTDMTVGARARGGPVRGGSPYMVGERGPELFVPGSSGNITPNHQLGGSTSIVVNVDASGSSVQGEAQEARSLGKVISAAIQQELVRQRRPGGLLSA